MTPPITDQALIDLVARVVARATRKRQGAPCLAVPFVLSDAQVATLIADARLAGVVSAAAADGAGSLRQGVFGARGDWRLPNGPYQTVYLAASPRRLTRAMVREAARHGVRTLTCQVGSGWIDLPLDRLGRLKAPLRWASAREQDARERFGRLRGAVARALVTTWPTAQPLARRIAGAAGIGGSPFETAFTSLIAARPPPLEPIPGRIVLVCGSLSPGGAERQAAVTAAGLVTAGHTDVTLLCHTLAAGPPHHHDFHRARAEAGGVRVAEIERVFAGAPIAALPTAVRPRDGWLPDALVVDIAHLYEVLRALRPAVVHAWLDWDCVRAGTAAVLAGVPRVVLSGRNLNPSHFVFHQPTMRPAYRALVDVPGVRLLNNTRAGALDYAAWLGIAAARIGVIPNGVSFEALTPPDAVTERTARARFGLPLDGPVIGGVFRFSPEKRPLLWLDMAAEVIKRLPNARFLLAGHGPMEREMRARVARLRLTEAVVFAGVVDAIQDALAAMDVLVLTSAAEGLPNVVLEAQAMGRPVLTPPAGGAVEALVPDVTGFVVDPATPTTLAAAAERALTDTAWRARAQATGPTYVRETFSIAQMVKATLDVYEDV